MSTLFLIGDPEFTGPALQTNENQDLSTVLEVLEEKPASFISTFARTVVLPDLDSLLKQIYKDRLLPLPNSWNYETGVALIVYNSQRMVPHMSIRQMNDLFRQYFATLNICFIDVHSGDANSADDYRGVLSGLQQDLSITKNRVLKMNHWMNHSQNSCSSNIYSMMRQFSAYVDSSASASSSSGNDTVPRIIRNMDFSQLINDSKSEQHYLSLLESWDFSALNLTTVELVRCGFFLIRHLSKLANIPITDNKLYLLLITIEMSYHQINKFHNFRHCIDVMQSCWQICERIIPQDHLTKLLLALAATGHDIGHPGTNNSLFQNSNNELMNNSSILEAFHYNIFSHILGQQWKKINMLGRGANTVNFIESGILATDMGIHAQFVKLITEKKTRQELSLKELVCLVIKAADISNVTRPLDVSAKWALLITLEFKDCALLQEFYKEESMSNDDTNCFELIKTHPCKEHLTKSDNIDMETEIKIYEILHDAQFLPDTLIQDYPMIPAGQIFFIDTFAYEFFHKLSIIFPELTFLVDNIVENKKYWVEKKQLQENNNPIQSSSSSRVAS